MRENKIREREKGRKKRRENDRRRFFCLFALRACMRGKRSSEIPMLCWLCFHRSGYYGRRRASNIDPQCDGMNATFYMDCGKIPQS